MNVLQIRKFLFEAYDGFADKRYKDLSKSNRFIVDDRSPSDLDAPGRLFNYFCSVFVEVDRPDKVEVFLYGNIPMSAGIEKWISANRATEECSGKGLRIVVSSGQEFVLEELASLMRAIVERGARYSVKSYKYVCPRTAHSLERLAGNLRKCWTNA